MMRKSSFELEILRIFLREITFGKLQRKDRLLMMAAAQVGRDEKTKAKKKTVEQKRGWNVDRGGFVWLMNATTEQLPFFIRIDQFIRSKQNHSPKPPHPNKTSIENQGNLHNPENSLRKTFNLNFYTIDKANSINFTWIIITMLRSFSLHPCVALSEDEGPVTWGSITKLRTTYLPAHIQPHTSGLLLNLHKNKKKLQKKRRMPVRAMARIHVRRGRSVGLMRKEKMRVNVTCVWGNWKSIWVFLVFLNLQFLLLSTYWKKCLQFCDSVFSLLHNESLFLHVYYVKTDIDFRT